MNRASQQALLQSTNQQLINIRQLEVNYYVSLNVAFGTQAALVGGFVYAVFTQNQINLTTPGHFISISIYWVLSSICVALAVHVILCTMLLQIYGPGLALNGPVGSMARAAEGLRIEQNQIISSFLAMMVMFALSTVMSFWFLMSVRSAAISTFFFLIAARYWYYYCERIFLRFYWDPEKSGWKERASRGESFDPADAITARKISGSGAIGQNSRSNMRSNEETPTFESEYKKNASKMSFPLLYWMYRHNTHKNSHRDSMDNGPATEINSLRFPAQARKGSLNVTADQRSATNSMSQRQQSSSAVQSRNINDLRAAMASTKDTAKGVMMEGYLTMRGMTKELRKQPWRRRYFTLTSAGQLYCYKSRQEYRADPKSPIYTRPFELADYFVRVDNLDEELRNHADGTGINFAEFDIFTEMDVASEYETNTVNGGDDAPMRSSMVIPKLDGPDPATQVKKMKPYRFQIALAPRDNEELHSGNKDMHRDWIVLRCDTEEELLIWVSVMEETSPDSFGRM